MQLGKQWYETRASHSTVYLLMHVAHVSSSLRLVLVNCGGEGKEKLGVSVLIMMSSGAAVGSNLAMYILLTASYSV